MVVELRSTSCAITLFGGLGIFMSIDATYKKHYSVARIAGSAYSHGMLSRCLCLRFIDTSSIIVHSLKVLLLPKDPTHR